MQEMPCLISNGSLISTWILLIHVRALTWRAQDHTNPTPASKTLILHVNTKLFSSRDEHSKYCDNLRQTFNIIQKFPGLPSRHNIMVPDIYNLF